MSKLRLIVLIIASIYVVFVLPLVILEIIQSSVYILIGIILFAIYYFTLRLEKVNLLRISKIYLNECDPLKYITEYKKYLSNFIQAKTNKYLNEITISLAYLSLGELGEAKNILDDLVEFEPNFSPPLRFWYYKAWIYYFEETKELERIKTLINQVKELIDISPLKFKTQLISNYNQIIARYYILANIHLNLAEQEFSKIFRANFPKFNVVVNVYYLGLIAYKQTDYKRALEYFRSVAKNGNKLSVVKKANEYIEKINEEIRKEF